MITGKAKLAGVIGWPVAHSLSPPLHGFWLNRLGVDGAYLPLPVHPEDLRDVLNCLPKIGFSGFNITIPHKERVLNLCDTVDETAEAIGAVNTVQIVDGRLHGSNTDGFGFLENLKATVDPGPHLLKPALILGAGGAARAISYALLNADVPEVRLTNRTKARAENLARVLGTNTSVVDWEKKTEALEDIGLLVNTTSLGMIGRPPLKFSLDGLGSQSLVADIVYAPLKTDLLKEAENRGNPTVDGLGMLLHQARPGFELWFGRAVVVDDMLRTHVLEHLRVRDGK